MCSDGKESDRMCCAIMCLLRIRCVIICLALKLLVFETVHQDCLIFVPADDILEKMDNEKKTRSLEDCMCNWTRAWMRFGCYSWFRFCMVNCHGP